MNDKLKQAINGQTVIIPFCDMEAFWSLDELNTWCAHYNLTYEYIEETASYKISKA